MSWRAVAAPIIARVLRETEGQPAKEIKAALREAYPFGPRQYWPYKVWLDEIRRQRTGRPPRRSKRSFDTETRPLFGQEEP